MLIKKFHFYEILIFCLIVHFYSFYFCFILKILSIYFYKLIMRYLSIKDIDLSYDIIDNTFSYFLNRCHCSLITFPLHAREQYLSQPVFSVMPVASTVGEICTILGGLFVSRFHTAGMIYIQSARLFLVIGQSEQ